MRTPVVGCLSDRAHRTQVARASERLQVDLIMEDSPPGAGAVGSNVRDLAGTIAAGVATAGDPHSGGGEPVTPAGVDRVPQLALLGQVGPRGNGNCSNRQGRSGQDLSRQENQVQGTDNRVWCRRRILQIEPQKFGYSLANCRVLVCEHPNGSLSLNTGLYLLGLFDLQGRPLHEGDRGEGRMRTREVASILWLLRCAPTPRVTRHTLRRREMVWLKASFRRGLIGRDIDGHRATRRIYLFTDGTDRLKKTGRHDVLMTSSQYGIRPRRLSENAIFVQIERFKSLIYKEIGFSGS